MSGSKGLQRYVPRILQDSGMIASSEVAHYTHLNLVQYVKADDADAALRAAKVEGLREAAGRVCMFCANLDGEWTDSIQTDFVRHVHPVSRRIEECKAWAIRARIAELERAAQIEEGGKQS